MLLVLVVLLPVLLLRYLPNSTLLLLLLWAKASHLLLLPFQHLLMLLQLLVHSLCVLVPGRRWRRVVPPFGLRKPELDELELVAQPTCRACDLLQLSLSCLQRHLRRR